MGNKCSCLRGRTEPVRKISIAILGIDGAGKTTTSKALLGDSLEVAPTVGFNTETLTVGKFEVSIFDIGGAKNVRSIWTHYFHEVYGVIYVVDSSASDRMAEIRENLHNLLSHPQVSGKPLLLLANKSDLNNAMESVDVCEKINLEHEVNMNKCPSRIESTCAVKGTGKKADAHLKEGVKWICGIIEHNWDQYSSRVERDVAAQRKKEEEEKAARRERVRKIKEEREKAEAEKRQKLGLEDPKSDEEDDIDGGDPFKRLNVKELERKQEKLKEDKRKMKELENRLKMEEGKRDRISRDDDNKNDDDDEDVDSDDLSARRSHRSPRHFNLSNGDTLTSLYSHSYNDKRNRLKQNNLRSEEDDSDIDIYPRGRKLTPRLPPLQRPLGTKFMDETAVVSTGAKKKKSKKQKLRSLQEIEDETEDDTYKKSLGSLSKIEFSARGGSFRDDYENEEEESEDGNNLRANRGYRNKENVQLSGYDNLTFTQKSRYDNQEDSLYKNGADSRFRNHNNLYTNTDKLSRFGSQDSPYNRLKNSRFEDREDSLNSNNVIKSRFGRNDVLYNNQEYNRQNGDLEDDSDVQKSQKKKGKKKKGKGRTSQEFSTTVFDHEDVNDSDEGFQRKRGGYHLPSLDGEDNADDVTHVRKLKKKHPYTVKKNKTFPSDPSDEDVPDTRHRDFSWTLSPKKTKIPESSESPVHMSRNNWGLAEELSAESSDDIGRNDNRMMRRSRPNMDDDEVVF